MILQSKIKSKPLLSFVLIVAIILVIFFGIGFLTKSKFFVTSLFEPPQQCLDQSDGYKKWSCFRPYFEKITNEVSASAAMAEAIKLEVQRVVSDCHLFGHFAGETTLEKHNFDMGKAFSSCGEGCLNGCFHGVMERYLRDETDLSNLPLQLKNICDDLGDSYGEKRRCVHGVGHGLSAHNYLSPINAANTCKIFGSDWEPYCIGGLLMEHVNQYLAWNLDEKGFQEIIPKICTSFEHSENSETNLIPNCIQMLSLGLLYYSGYDLERSKELCEELPQQKNIDQCRHDMEIMTLEEIPSNIDFENFILTPQ